LTHVGDYTPTNLINKTIDFYFMTKGFDIPRNWSCKKVKGKKMAVCSPSTKHHKVHYVHKTHKGHRTRRGLAQDQRRHSKEPWEKAYRKK